MLCGVLCRALSSRRMWSTSAMRCLLLPSLLRSGRGCRSAARARLASEGLHARVDRPCAAVVQAADVAVEDVADELADRREHPVLRVQRRLVRGAGEVFGEVIEQRFLIGALRAPAGCAPSALIATRTASASSVRVGVGGS